MILRKFVDYLDSKNMQTVCGFPPAVGRDKPATSCGRRCENCVLASPEMGDHEEYQDESFNKVIEIELQ